MAWTGTRRRDELPADWPALRRAALRRDGFSCQAPGCGAPATDVDHIGDRHDHRLGNLRSLCADCHRRRTSAQGHAAARSAMVRERQARPAERHPGLLPLDGQPPRPQSAPAPGPASAVDSLPEPLKSPQNGAQGL